MNIYTCRISWNDDDDDQLKIQNRIRRIPKLANVLQGNV